MPGRRTEAVGPDAARAAAVRGTEPRAVVGAVSEGVRRSGRAYELPTIVDRGALASLSRAGFDSLAVSHGSFDT